MLNQKAERIDKVLIKNPYNWMAAEGHMDGRRKGLDVGLLYCIVLTQALQKWLKILVSFHLFFKRQLT